MSAFTEFTENEISKLETAFESSTNYGNFCAYIRNKYPELGTRLRIIFPEGFRELYNNPQSFGIHIDTGLDDLLSEFALIDENELELIKGGLSEEQAIKKFGINFG